MSSNAFARSRPRVRHQRVPKTPSYAHPRFLQLIKELGRLDEAKKKLEGSTSTASSISTGRDTTFHDGGQESSVTGREVSCLNSTGTPSTQQIIAQLSHTNQHQQSHHHHHHNHYTNLTRHQQQQSQQQTVAECCPGLSGPNYSSLVTEAQTSNGYRSLELNQSTSTLHDNYYRQSNLNDTDNHQVVPHQLHHQNYSSHHQRHNSYLSGQQESFTQPNNVQQMQHQDYRCPNKCSSSSATANTGFAYSKVSVAQQSTSHSTTNSDPDPRQDENRSKRKRSGNDTPSVVKKYPSTSTSPPACSKRQKSSPEPPRPLSPSFTKCPICLLDCMNRDPSFTNTCFHLFCFVCIENWSKSKATCPLCRTKFSKIIYNIKSESCFDEKVASPLRRDDDDDRFTYEQLTAHSMAQSRTSHADEARLLFDNLRNNDVLMPHLVFTNQIDPRQVDSLHSFNSITNNANFSSSVPHTPFSAANYAPVGSNYINVALIPSTGRLQATSTSSAITSAYPTNTSLSNISSDTSNRIPRVSRSGRYIYSRNFDLTSIDSSVRGSRSAGTGLNQPGLSLESRQQHHSIPHPNHHQHHAHHHSQPQHRSTVTTIELGPTRQSHHQHIHLPYHLQPRPYTNPTVYSRRPYTNPPIEQHILDDLYTQIPEM